MPRIHQHNGLDQQAGAQIIQQLPTLNTTNVVVQQNQVKGHPLGQVDGRVNAGGLVKLDVQVERPASHLGNFQHRAVIVHRQKIKIALHFAYS